ncbi:MAG TPA: hypothetical protein VK395_26870 [Gemmataceae bacterium]|nr:hypothetical protein [Gemmataceae bacterium]
MSERTVFEGTWEEIAARAPEFAGRRVRLTVLSQQQAADSSLDGSQPFWANIRPEELLDRLGAKPVTNVEAYLKTLPHLGDEVTELWQAIADDRARRRSLAESAG